MEQTFGEKLKTLGGVHYHLDESINFENDSDGAYIVKAALTVKDLIVSADLQQV